MLVHNARIRGDISESVERVMLRSSCVVSLLKFCIDSRIDSKAFSPRRLWRGKCWVRSSLNAYYLLKLAFFHREPIQYQASLPVVARLQMNRETVRISQIIATVWTDVHTSCDANGTFLIRPVINIEDVTFARCEACFRRPGPGRRSRGPHFRSAVCR